MKSIIPLALLLLLTLAFSAPAQEIAGMISGTISDASEKTPIEYANIILFRQSDGEQLTGTTSDTEGAFQIEGLRTGVYYLEIRFVGYETKKVENIAVNDRFRSVELDELRLQPTALDMESVVVEAERAAMTYQIDKKVINVSEHQTTLSGTAVDVLENVPSVSVDIEGNVSLRGSSNFRVLIDGRPTVLDASDALEQIPASTIENIEIITNPSAKHDPEGAAGIINIVLKEDEELGRSGIVNLNAGYDDKYGIDALLNYNKRKYNTSLSVDFNQRNYDGSDREMNQTFLPGGDSFVHSTGESGRGRSRYGIRGSFEYKFNRKNSLSLGGRFRDGESSNQSFLDYDTWKEPGGEHTFYLSNTERSRGGYDVDLYMTYLRQFARKGQELVAEIEFERGTGDELTTNELLTPDGIITSGQRSTESGPSEEVRAKLDYVHPLGEYSKFEAGYQSDYDRSKEETGLSEYSTDLQAYEVLDEFSNLTQYDRYIHALYAIYGGKRHSLGYQAGIRGEYTNRTVDVTRSAESFKIDRWDYFPTLHFSYEFSQGNQAMASYTRRIDRPRGWYLEPFDTWMDAYNVRRGNPGLKPEYIDSYEAGYQTMLGNTVVSAETYYRANNNKVESVRSVYGDNITLQTMENVGKDYSFGTELMLGLEPLKQWDLNLMGNLYKYRVEGVIADESFDRESFNWSLRFNNNFKFSESLQFQLHTIYNSPTVSSQGRREAFFMTNVAVKYVFFEKLLSATLQVRDLLGTAKYERTSRGNDFYIYNYGTRESPVVMVNLKYNFNNYESERRDDNGAQGEGFGGDDF